MFGKKSEYRLPGPIESLIGVAARIEGDVCFSGGLRIDGVVKGNVAAAEGASSSVLILSEHARVEGGVSVGTLVSNGTIIGPVTARDFLELQARARIVGDVRYTSIEMHQGAVIEGGLVYLSQPSEELKPDSGN